MRTSFRQKIVEHDWGVDVMFDSGDAKTVLSYMRDMLYKIDSIRGNYDIDEEEFEWYLTMVKGEDNGEIQGFIDFILLCIDTDVKFISGEMNTPLTTRFVYCPRTKKREKTKNIHKPTTPSEGILERMEAYDEAKQLQIRYK